MEQPLNRLCGQRCYLSGPMQFTPDNGAGWRNTITPILQDMGIVVINPITKQIEGLQEDVAFEIKRKKLRKKQDWVGFTNLMKPVRHADLRLVDVSDFMLVVLDMGHFPCGTYEELFCANRQKKPILLCMQQGKQFVPDWLFATIPYQMIFGNMDDLLTYLGYINNAEKIDDSGRWLFPRWI